MRSLRVRIALTAAAVTAVALSIAAVFVLRGLERSLLDQLDDAISDQVIDYDLNITDYASFETVGSLNDIDTLLVIFDEADPEPWLANDLGVQVREVVDELPFARSLLLDDPLVVDASIQSATDTPGADSMRAAIVPLFLDDQPVDDPIIYAMVARATGPIDETVAATRNRLMLALPALVVLVGALAWWLTGRALRPVDRLRNEVDEITAGDLRRRVTESRSADEVDRLAVTMNDMLERLEESSQRQQQFVSDAAHELRTPLASMAAQLDVDASHPEGADHAATARSVRAEVDRMRDLVDALLALARSDQGRAPVGELRLVDLQEIARASAQRVPKPPHVALTAHELPPVEARGDESALSRIVDNLLANAYRHAASGVAIAVGQDTDGGWLTVEDDGAGVPVHSREAIFERFVRLDEARDRDRGGSGLGLALSRELAVAHGGRLFVTDGAAGGARFVLRLPPSDSPAAQSAQ